MPEVDRYKQGTPCWVDLSSTDIEVSKKFYRELFGWELEAMDVGRGLTYYMARLKGRYVAGMMQQLPDAPPGMPSYWANYLAVDSVDAAAERAVAAGGTVVVAPDSVPNGSGRMFFAADPTGAQIGFWEAGTHLGSGIINEPGTMIWNELQTNDVPKAVAFYEAVTGCTSSTGPAGDQREYTSLLVEGRPVAGALKVPIEGLLPFWMTYFNVEDVDQALQQAVDLGGHVIAPAFDVPAIGRMAVLMDPAGAAFSIMSGLPA
ncbi:MULTISPECIES: VOC family protein [Paenarthrobacter]|uniref:VOC family protein n=1 Tax=Paenarthrobacter ureafaciens TaxID=37931 RepID=A0AAX3EGI9_PAEUR|nr:MULTISPECIES: VOC family protein [Paenarthrobacter]MDO5866231.1 VOC family protein [Paenarthrobacter sp. SD-2]MDO5877330.1 VOC family protein [Paenarthrobacter sp. SD-1]UYV92523.1 VOC family protein [Paenarthrobacter ureafaciens]UYV97058.1 VOC family protein [Paenarthrobacter ureafaciens]WIV32427.1 VOC family protein [Paenarthrobacter sp. R1]